VLLKVSVCRCVCLFVWLTNVAVEMCTLLGFVLLWIACVYIPYIHACVPLCHNVSVDRGEGCDCSRHDL